MLKLSLIGWSRASALRTNLRAVNPTKTASRPLFSSDPQAYLRADVSVAAPKLQLVAERHRMPGGLLMCLPTKLVMPNTHILR